MTSAAEQIDPPLLKEAVRRRRSLGNEFEISITSVATAAIWIGCVAIGILGILIPYARPIARKAQPPAIQAELLEVALTTDTVAIEDIAAPPPDALAPPPAIKPLAPVTAPALIPVAAPNPAIAFELPVTGPTRIVPAKEASYSAPATPSDDSIAAQPAVSQLTFGRGEGKQPAPTYPPRALSEGQEGTVRIEFTVGPDGRAIAAEIVSRSQWPLLNEAALKVIRERWRFAPGPTRRYEVPIHFRIRK